MKPYPYLPGVPAAGHISDGYWHPGAISTCQKGTCGREQRREQRRKPGSEPGTTRPEEA